MRRIFWNINIFLYRLLGPNTSTRLSQSMLGKGVLRVIGMTPKGMHIYRGQNDIKLRLSPQEASYFGFLHFGLMNVHETNLMKNVVGKGDAVIDIGGYVDGWHSIVAGRLVGATGHVYTFEPIPNFCSRLEENIALNNLTNITVEHLAVSNKNGYAYVYNNNASSSFFEEHASHGQALALARVKVKTVMLDSYCKTHQIKTVRLIKVDAEGAEMDVLRGAVNLLKKKGGPDLILEVDDRYLQDGGTSEFKILRYLRKFGYTPYSILSGGRLGVYKKKSKGRELFNVFFSKIRYI